MAASGLWQTKSIEQSIADTDEPGTRLHRNLGALDIGLIVYFGYGARKSRLRQGDRVHV